MANKITLEAIDLILYVVGVNVNHYIQFYKEVKAGDLAITEENLQAHIENIDEIAKRVDSLFRKEAVANIYSSLSMNLREDILAGVNLLRQIKVQLQELETVDPEELETEEKDDTIYANEKMEAVMLKFTKEAALRVPWRRTIGEA